MFGKRQTEFGKHRRKPGLNKNNAPINEITSQTTAESIKHIMPIIINVEQDNRPYAEINVLGHKITGLLDSGAQVTIIGGNFENILDLRNISHTLVNQIVKTADGTQHTVNKVYHLPVSHDGVTNIINALYVPSMPNTLILGIDFWNIFGIKPVICSSLEISKTPPVTLNHDLTTDEAQQLQNILKCMPFCKTGVLSQTHLISHSINTDGAKPIKQKHYMVSPYIQKHIDEEIDRLLALDVIQKCPGSEWSNPIVAVKKPSGKIRVCLDARKLNNVTIKDVYPQQQINRILGRLTGTRF